jgi:hypothetical protein
LVENRQLAVSGHRQYVDSALAEWRGSLLFLIRRKRRSFEKYCLAQRLVFWTELRAGRLNFFIGGSLDNDRGNWNSPSCKIAVDAGYYSLTAQPGTGIRVN